MRTLSVLALVMVTLLGCGGPADETGSETASEETNAPAETSTLTLDGSSLEAFADSITKLQESLSPEEFERFNEALNVLMKQDAGDLFADGMREGFAGRDVQKVADEWMEKKISQINGLSAEQVIARADALPPQESEEPTE